MNQDRYDKRVKFLLKKLATYHEMGVAEKAVNATKLLLAEMSKKMGFERHDGRDYYVHPVAIAQTAIDFRLVKFNTGKHLSKIEVRENEESDALLCGCLLHDIIEDVEWVDKDYIINEYGEYIYNVIDNVTKREGEPTEKYLDRVASLRLSSLIKILDRLNNVSTMANSSLKHRKRQLEETRKYYLPLEKELRCIYFEDASFYWQARTFMVSLLNEVERSIKLEEQLVIMQECENREKDGPLREI